MPRLTAIDAARLRGVQAAHAEHERLGLSMRERVEIFDIIEDARIWLLFKPLTSLFGAYERYADAAGIVINANHPLTLQRFTAAHEYGHHVLGHTASADDETHIYRGRSQSLQEVAAQSFAGEFILPLQLVNYSLRTMGIVDRHPNLTAEQIYQLALELGVSYRAAITQLVGQRKLSFGAGRRLRQTSPLDIKRGLAGVKPEYSWADVWILDEAQEGRQLVPRRRDEIHVMLAETPSTGYVWQLVDAAPSVLALVADSFDSSDDLDAIGGEGLRHLRFRVDHAGTGRIRLEKRRPWQADVRPVASFEATLAAVAPTTGDVGDGLAEVQKQGVIDEFRADAA
jgi:Zn-dependent peptidase ImmA (M78 family)/predicted secreted protein